VFSALLSVSILIPLDLKKGIAPYAAIEFTTFSYLQKTCRRNDKVAPISNVTAGAGAAMLAQLGNEILSLVSLPVLSIIFWFV
jgi:hypothetical protein